MKLINLFPKKSASLAAVTAFVLLTTAPLVSIAQVIKIDGSSTVYPITEAVAEEFQKSNKGLKVTVGISGTGGGFKSAPGPPDATQNPTGLKVASDPAPNNAIRS